jgi:hypothetical protein
MATLLRRINDDYPLQVKNGLFENVGFRQILLPCGGGSRCLRTSLATDCFLLSPEWPFLIGRFWRILLKKSFWGGERNFLGLLMRLMRGDVRDHVASQKNDHGASYRRCEASQS